MLTNNGVSASGTLTGQVFRSSTEDGQLEDRKAHDTLIRTGALVSAIEWTVSVLGQFSGQLREGVTVSATGKVSEVSNLNRNSTIVSNVSVFTDPTITNLGDLLLSFQVPTDRYVGIAPTTTLGWILKPNTDYLLIIFNESGQVSEVNVDLETFNKVA